MWYGVAIVLSTSAVYAVASEKTESAEQAITDIEPIVFGQAGDYLASQHARSEGDLTAAIHYLRRVIKKQPEDPEVGMQLIGMLLLDGQIEEALKIANGIPPSEGKDPVILLMQSLLHIKQKSIDAARLELKNAKDEGLIQLWLPLVSAWADAAVGQLLKPLTLDDLQINAGRAAPILNYHLALINDYAGFKEAAALNFKDSISANVENPPSRVMARLLHFYDNNRAPDVLAPLVDNFMEANPEQSTQQDVKPITNAEEGIAEVLLTMGNVMQSANILQDAVVYLQLALYLQPDMDSAGVTLGEIYGQLKMYNKANTVYSRVSPSSSYYTEARLNMALNNDKLGKPDEAMRILDRLAKKEAYVFEALVAKADLMRIHGQLADAIEGYTQALARLDTVEKKHWPVFFARAACQERLDRWEQAEKDLQRALELSPDEPQVLNYLGFSWLVRGENTQQATEMIQKAIEARPNDPQIIDSMGWAMYLKGDYHQAEGYLEKALSLIPNNPVINDHLGDVYWRQGRRTEARFQWERSLTFSPEAKLEADLQRKLKDGLPPVERNKVPVVAAEQVNTNPVP